MHASFMAGVQMPEAMIGQAAKALMVGHYAYVRILESCIVDGHLRVVGLLAI